MKGRAHLCGLIYISVGRRGALEVGTGAGGNRCKDLDHTLAGTQVAVGLCVLWVSFCVF